MDAHARAPQFQLAPRKKSFWKMVKTIFIPAQSAIRLMTGCGGGRGSKVKRRLTMRNMQEAKDVFLRSTISRPPPTANNRNEFRSSSNYSEPQSPPPTIPAPPLTESELLAYEDIGIYAPLASQRPPVNEPTREHLSLSPNNTSDASTLPAPLNLEEAQILLEALALNCSNSLSEGGDGNRHEGSWVEQLVNVDVEPEPEPISQSPEQSREETSSHLSSSASSILGEGEANEIEINNERTFNGNKTRIELSSTSRLESISYYTNDNNDDHHIDNNRMSRSRTSASLSCSTSRSGDDDFHGWRRSSIEVSSSPPVTLAFIPSGLCIGDRIVWVKDDHPEIGTVRWIGKIRNQFYAGIEFDKPVGNSSGIYGYGVGLYKRLFTCQLAYGRFIPVKELVLYKDYHDTGVKSGIVCIICRDDFLDTWEPDISLQTINNNSEDIQAPNMVSTKCGHLYHWGCLDHWFSTKKRSEFHCPFCLKPMARDEVIRIFPSQI